MLDEGHGGALNLPEWCEVHLTVGLRSCLAVGPRRPPLPRTYVRWDGETRRSVGVWFAQQLAVSESLITRWNCAAQGRLHIAMAFPTHHPETWKGTAAQLTELTAQARATRALSTKYGLLFTQNGHSRRSVPFANDVFDILGPDVLLSHATGMTDAEIAIVARTGTKIVRNPSANAAIREHFRLTELLDAGATVMLGSDGSAPDRSYDMFRHMFMAMHYHRTYYRDTKVLPAHPCVGGKVSSLTLTWTPFSAFIRTTAHAGRPAHIGFGVSRLVHSDARIPRDA